ncbi:MAG: capsule assembly Wzi family protein [bacterium]
MCKLCPSGTLSLFMPLLFLITFAIAQAGLEYVPTDSRIYEDLDLLKTSGFIRTLPSTSRPWTKEECLKLLLEADSLSRAENLTAVPRAALDRLRWEFGTELKSNRAKKPAVSLNLPDGVVGVDFFSRARVEKEKQRLSFGTVLNNRPSDRFFFYERIEVIGMNPKQGTMFDSSGWHNPRTRVCAWRDRVLWEMERAYFGFKLPWLRLELGRDEFFWGPGYNSSVMLSDNAPALDQIQFSLFGPNLKFVGFTALLSRWNLRHRFLSGQRLEVFLFRRLVLGAAMFNVYTWESALDFSGMLNPLLPLYFSVANSGHGDNLLVGWDAVLYLPRSKIYGQLFLDNYEFNRRNNAPNCVGLQAGLLFLPPAAIDFRVEYALITAFTYYHRLRDIMFENYSVPLGHEIGPDADRLWMRFRLMPLSYFSSSVWADYTRRGYYNWGDYERLSFDKEDLVFLRDYYSFPARGYDSLGHLLWEVEKTFRIGPEIAITPLTALDITIRVALSYCQNQNGIIGDNHTAPEFFLKVEYRY